MQNNKLIYTLILIFILISIIYWPKQSHIDQKKNIEPDKALLVINQSLSVLELDLREMNYKHVCSNALQVIELISNNQKGLKSIEPYYDWESIQNVLIELRGKHCLEDHHEQKEFPSQRKTEED